MTCVRDIMTLEGLNRELRGIRRFFKDSLKEDEKPLRIEWGTRQAMEIANRERARRPSISNSKYRYECRRCRCTFVGLLYGPIAYFLHRLLSHAPKIRIEVDWRDGWLRQRRG